MIVRYLANSRKDNIMGERIVPEIGSKAPSFILNDQDGSKVKLSDLRDKWIALYFYPKDDTPG